MATKKAAKTSSRKKTNKSRSNTSARSSTRKTRNNAKQTRNNEVSLEIAILITIALSLILFLGNLGVDAFVVSKLAYVFFGLFGVMEYIFPILAFVLVWVVLANMGNKKVRNKVILISILFCLICAFIQLGYGYEDDYIDFFIHSAIYETQGGFIGGLIAKTLGVLVGTAGAYIIIIIAVLILACLATGKTLLMSGIRGLKKLITSLIDIITNGMESNDDYLVVDFENDEIEEEKPKHTIQVRKKSSTSSIRDAGSSLFHTLSEIPSSINESENEKHKNTIEFKIPESVNHHKGDLILEPKDLDNEITEIRDELDQETANIIDKQDEKVTREDTKKETKTLASQVENNNKVYKNYKLPTTSLLTKGTSSKKNDSDAREKAIKLNMILESFGVRAKVVGYTKGPSVTQFEVQPDIGVKVKKISDLADDIKLGLAVADIRIEAPIPGKSVVGIEVPNGSSTGVLLRDLLESSEFKNAKSKISFAVGRNIAGNVVVSDIAKLPHLLIGGSTGSGKSVFMNTLIMSILYKATPDEVKFFMIDPKMIELSVYNRIPHLFVPVVTDPKKAAGVLNYAVVEMTKRYKAFKDLGVKNLEEYNEKILTLPQNEDKSAYLKDGQEFKKKPQIVIVVDEFADLMMVAKGEVEESVCRLAQLARAAGIHLILATQRPSVDVITGLIKANMPSRCALLVSSGVDSRTIIDQVGAEKLLGNGDMLYSPSGTNHPIRIQGAYVSGTEVEKVVDAIVKQNGTLEIDESVEEEINSAINNGSMTGGAVSINGSNDDSDEHLFAAGCLIIEKQKASVGMLQRQYKIGFNRAARIMDTLHEYGVVSEEEGTKPRKVLMTSVDEFKARFKED